MKKIAIIGAGPIGLYFASLLEKNKIPYTIFEATDKIGGQIVNLYPHKKFLDVEGFMNQEAETFINDLKTKVNLKQINFNEKVIDIVEKEKVTVTTNKNSYEFDYVVIAVGLGMYTPRTMGLEGEDQCKNILYSLNNFDFLYGKRVAIFGGGDSALDWSKELSLHSDNIHLVHRRTEFRGNPDTIKDCKNLKVHLPYVPHKLTRNGDLCTIITIKNVNSEETIDIPVDYVVVNYGCVPISTPFKYEHSGIFLKVNDKYAVSNRVFAIGDCAFYEKKLRRIEPGKKEANAVFAYLAQLAD
ncbi:MAG: NAD(P)/FAD-dependent oxidoreductase [Bacilli bacterium]|nr:NAD(P)/FAD-dependent oxidoreductase [Bacilli bacterium]